MHPPSGAWRKSLRADHMPPGARCNPRNAGSFWEGWVMHSDRSAKPASHVMRHGRSHRKAAALVTIAAKRRANALIEKLHALDRQRDAERMAAR